MTNRRSGSAPRPSPRMQLAALLLLFLGLHALYNWAIPLGEGPDEHGHLAYALFLAAEGRLPVQREDAAASDVPGEGHQPPLAYALAAPAVAWLPAGERQILLTANPRFLWAGGDEPGAFMRGSRELAPWPPLTLAWHLARAVSGLWGAAAVVFTYLAARRLRPADPALAPLAAALVALNPQLLFTTALVSNDALLAALGAALLWWCVRGGHGEGGTRGGRDAGTRSEGEGERGSEGARERGSEGAGERGSGGVGAGALGWAVVAGGLFGLALLTKQSALLLGPVVLLAGWRAAGGRWGRAAALTLVWGLTSLLVSGWWFLRNLVLYGDIFGLAAFQTEFATQPFAWGDPTAWWGAALQLFGSFWGRFGWMSLPAPAWSLWLYAGLCLVAAGGLARLRPLRALAGPWALAAVAAAMALAWTLAFAYTAGLVAWQGRMLFPAIAAIALALAAGLLAALRALPRRSSSLASPVLPSPPPRLPASPPPRLPAFPTLPLAALLAALAVFMPLGVIRPGYTWVALPPEAARAGLGTPIFARYADYYEGGVILRGWRLDGPPTPGAELPVTLTWNSEGIVPRLWTVFVHLVDASGQIVAQSNSQPRDGTLPFPIWTPGDWVADTHRLALPADLAPGEYELRVGLYRAETDGRRQRVWAEDDTRIGDQAVLGRVRVP